MPSDNDAEVRDKEIREPVSLVDSPKIARDIISILRDNNIHPVLVFGTHQSGKTAMLQSLFHYAKSKDDSKIALTRGSVIWPGDGKDNERISVEESGRAFLDNDLVSFDKRQRPEATFRLSHFFIPADVTHKGHLTRFAFLEGMGEWIEREEVKGPAQSPTPGAPPKPMPFRPLREIVKQLLQSFEHGISMIFVAPCVDGPDGSSKDYAHECLDHLLGEIERLRGDKQRDNLLLLLNKWDAVCSPAHPGGHFADATADFVLERVRSWRFIWPRYVALHGFPDSARAVMPYAAAWFGGNGEIMPSSQYATIFARYNRTLWNWIYGNASVAVSGDVRTGRKILYPDVMPDTPQPMKPWEKMTRLLTINKL